MRLYERFADKDFHTSIATSFGIDFDAYESIVLSRLRGAGCCNNIVVADGRMLTHALAGASALPRHAGRHYTVSGASAEGVFHPKIFLQAGRRRGRLIVSSANLTSPGLAGNLELAGMIACDHTASGEQQLIAQAFAYVSRFTDDRSQQGLVGQVDWLLRRAPWLVHAAPAPGLVGLSDGTRAALLTTGHTKGIGERFVDFVDEPVSRLIVVSPYWDIDLAALAFLGRRLSPGEVCILLDPEAKSFPKQALGAIARARLYDRGDFRKGRFIHAKVIIAQTASADHVLLGSANCTVPALGLDVTAGSNEEVCLYRRLPPRTVEGVLGLDVVIAPERQIDAAALPDLHLDEDLPLDELTAQTPGKFECRVDTLIWRPSASYEPASSTVMLLDRYGKLLPCRLAPLSVEEGAVRFLIEDSPDRPAFARVQNRSGRLSAPAIVTLIDRIRATTRETSSRQADNALRELDSETEASLLLLDVLNVLERIEQGDRASGASLSIPKKRKHEESAQPEHRTLTYEEFIAGRRKRSATQGTHNSLAGNDVSLVRNFLNRIVGLSADDNEEVDGDTDVPGNAFDMGDETADAESALAAGDEFDTGKACGKEEERAKEEQRRTAARKATKEQIVGAVTAFRERIRTRKEAGALDNHDVFRLRALLMVICTAGCPSPAGKHGTPSRLQVLLPEGGQDSWPLLLGRTLFEIFGGNHPAIRNLYLVSEHDQIPDDVIECWASCYWCLQACLTAPLSEREQARITQYLRPLAELAYRLTLPTREELFGDDVSAVMTAMSESYAERLGIDPAAIVRGHHALVETLFHGTATAAQRAGARAMAGFTGEPEARKP